MKISDSYVILSIKYVVIIIILCDNPTYHSLKIHTNVKLYKKNNAPN